MASTGSTVPLWSTKTQLWPRAISIEPAEDGRNAQPEEEEPEEEAAAGAANLTAALMSWAAGVAFGRFDVRLATGNAQPPPEPDLFDPLPPCSPGMLTGEDGLPSLTPRAIRSSSRSNGILADDPGTEPTSPAAVRAVFDCVFGAEADRFWTEAAEILGNDDGDLRPWLTRSLFDDTIRRYSKSRRKAPIYWQLATPSASYSVWLYYHA